MLEPPNYEHYSREELEDVARHIDRQKYPERYALVLRELEARANGKPSPPSTDPAKTRSGCAPGCFLGMAAGLAGGILWGQLWTPPGPKSGDGMDVAFGLIGLAITGILVGGYFGALIGACFNRK